jgi:hypothetical protein
VSAEEVRGIEERLAEPFDPENVHCKPLTISGSRALAAWYCDARDVMDRLDEVLGVDGWEDGYTILPDGNVVCVLRCRIGDAWLAKSDVGGPSEQPDEGDRMKAAFSDALKRAAVKFGVGRYLYRLGRQWYDFDPAKKKFVNPPKLPASALPRARAPAAKAPAAPAPRPAPAELPNNGPELVKWLARMDRFGADKHWYESGKLHAHVMHHATEQLWQGIPESWEADHIREAIDVAREFMREREAYFKASKKPVPEVTSA